VSHELLKLFLGTSLIETSTETREEDKGFLRKFLDENVLNAE
jgi:hypothetical protein